MLIDVSQKNTSTFRLALDEFNKSGIPYAIGGAFAMYHYSGMWRDTNDLDIYLLRPHIPEAIETLARSGFDDIGEMAAGDREWIHHARKDGVIVDLIWETPNHMAAIDPTFYAKAESSTFLDIPVRFLPADGLVWTKIFTLNHHRCDWPDIFAIVRSRPQSLDWGFLQQKLGENWPVLLSFVLLFDWVYPSERSAIPNDLRDELLSYAAEPGTAIPSASRELMLDPWIYSRPITP